MQAGKKAAENAAATAKSGMEKTKATLQEKTEKMNAHDPALKQMATEKKEARMAEAEYQKQENREDKAAQKMANTAEARPGYTPGSAGYTSGPNVTSAVPGYGTDAPAGNVEEGAVGVCPPGMLRKEQ
ncbi:hypothetical protein Droror1_Dr00009303 [Drosera rotundifolia]